MNALTKSAAAKAAASVSEQLSEVTDIGVSRGLGWASIAVGLTELSAPKQLENLMGIGNGQTTGILRVLGVRELMHGIDILSHRDPTPGIWSRVAGDALDGVLLGVAATKTRRPGGFLAVCAAVLPLVILDLVFAPRSATGARH